jgi:hypothetical protein
MPGGAEALFLSERTIPINNLALDREGSALWNTKNEEKFLNEHAS